MILKEFYAKKKFKLVHKSGSKIFDKRGWLKKVLDGNFSSCIEIYSKKGSITVLIVAHRTDTLTECDKIYRIEK